MMTEANEMVDTIQKEPGELESLCSLFVESEVFGIDTRQIREVLGERKPQRVPMSPSLSEVRLAVPHPVSQAGSWRWTGATGRL